MKKQQKGFTLIELMIVVAIIGILAAIAVPKFAQMMEKSREGATQGNIGALKSAISIYVGDMQGENPKDLTDWFSNGNIAQAMGPSFKTYMDNIPPVKVTGKNDNSQNNSAIAAPFKYNGVDPSNGGIMLLRQNDDAAKNTWAAATGNDKGQGWIYESTAGLIYVNSSVVDSTRRAMPYSTYGY